MKEINQVTAFIIDYIKQSSDSDNVVITNDADFVSSGWLDSFGILSLIMALESSFNVKFEPAELANTKLRVIKNMARCVMNKMSHE